MQPRISSSNSRGTRTTKTLHDARSDRSKSAIEKIRKRKSTKAKTPEELKREKEIERAVKKFKLDLDKKEKRLLSEWKKLTENKTFLDYVKQSMEDSTTLTYNLTKRLINEDFKVIFEGLPLKIKRDFSNKLSNLIYNFINNYRNSL